MRYSELLGYDTLELLARLLTMMAHSEEIPEHLVLWDEVFRRNECSNVGRPCRYRGKEVRLVGAAIFARVSSWRLSGLAIRKSCRIRLPSEPLRSSD